MKISDFQLIYNQSDIDEIQKYDGKAYCKTHDLLDLCYLLVAFGALFMLDICLHALQNDSYIASDLAHIDGFDSFVAFWDYVCLVSGICIGIFFILIRIIYKILKSYYDKKYTVCGIPILDSHISRNTFLIEKILMVKGNPLVKYKDYLAEDFEVHYEVKDWDFLHPGICEITIFQDSFAYKSLDDKEKTSKKTDELFATEGNIEKDDIPKEYCRIYIPKSELQNFEHNWEYKLIDFSWMKLDNHTIIH